MSNGPFRFEIDEGSIAYLHDIEKPDKVEMIGEPLTQSDQVVAVFELTTPEGVGGYIVARCANDGVIEDTLQLTVDQVRAMGNGKLTTGIGRACIPGMIEKHYPEEFGSPSDF